MGGGGIQCGKKILQGPADGARQWRRAGFGIRPQAVASQRQQLCSALRKPTWAALISVPFAHTHARPPAYTHGDGALAEVATEGTLQCLVKDAAVATRGRGRFLALGLALGHAVRLWTAEGAAGTVRPSMATAP